MNPLPNITLDWDESAEPYETFVRYQVYRRTSADDDWTKIARINDRGLTTYSDYRAKSGVTYEYTVTIVKTSDSSEEVESAKADSVFASLTCRSTFIHVVGNPGQYVEHFPVASSYEPKQEQAFLQPRDLPAPVMHVGQQYWRELQFDITREWATDSDRWQRLEDLYAAQLSGNILMIRGYRVPGLFVQMVRLPRKDSAVTFGATVSLIEANYPESVP